TDQYQQAVNAYNHIDRSSSEFGTMLYELAWVYVKLGDIERAQRALEVLAIAEPNSTNIADGSLLRGDLMLGPASSRTRSRSTRACGTATTRCATRSRRSSGRRATRPSTTTGSRR